MACGSAAVGPLSYLLQYKRSVLANPTGLAAFNGFGGTPFGFGGYGQPGFAAYGQPGFAAYNQPGLAAYNQPDLAAYNQPGFAAYGQPSFGGAYGLDDLRPHQAHAFAPAAALQYGAQSGYGFGAAPASSGYPFAVHYKLSPAAAAPQLLYAPNAQQSRTALTTPNAPHADGRQPSAAAPSAAPQHPAHDKARQVRVMSPTVAAESTATRFQIPLSYQPAPPTSDATAPSSAPAAPDLFLELRPPHYSEPSIDYSRSPVSSPSDGGPHMDFGSASSSSANVNRGESYPAPGYGTSVPFSGGVQGAPPSHAYLIPSISYTLPTNTYSHTEPNAVNDPYGKTAPKSVPDVPNDFASNALYGESDSTGGPVSNVFPSAYYSVPVDVPSASSRGNSNPTSANTYGDSNSIQSGSHGSDKPVAAGNVRGGSAPSDKRDTSNVAQSDKRSPISYFGGDYKNVQRNTY